MKKRWFITGDLHGALHSITNFIQEHNLGKESNIIVLGDMGIAWRKDLVDYNFKITRYEERCNGVHLYWLDGNHENFDIISSWSLNKDGIYDNSPHIHYCSRGSSILINGAKALFIGGADSIDKVFRKEGLDWWPRETIDKKDIENIKGKYKYVFSHCCPKSIFDNYKMFLCTLTNINENNVIHSSEEKLEQVKNNITYDKWFFGHYHVNCRLDNKHHCLFEDFIEVE